jgi:hypothetical protein
MKGELFVGHLPHGRGEVPNSERTIDLKCSIDLSRRTLGVQKAAADQTIVLLCNKWRVFGALKCEPRRLFREPLLNDVMPPRAC